LRPAKPQLERLPVSKGMVSHCRSAVTPSGFGQTPIPLVSRRLGPDIEAAAKMTVYARLDGAN